MAKTERTVVKKVPNAVLFSDGTIRVDNVRASYPHLAEPYSKDGEKGKYGVVGMLPKETHAQAKELLKEYIQKLLKDNDAKVGSDKWFLRDGDNSDKSEYEGHWTINTSESRRPSVRGRNGGVVDQDKVADMFYGGCWINVLIRPWYQDGVRYGKGFGKKVNCGLQAVQFVRDDESFGDGRIDDEGVWDTTEDDDQGYDFSGESDDL